MWIGSGGSLRSETVRLRWQEVEIEVVHWMAIDRSIDKPHKRCERCEVVGWLLRGSWFTGRLLVHVQVVLLLQEISEVSECH